jgi:hypothetical protein
MTRQKYFRRRRQYSASKKGLLQMTFDLMWSIPRMILVVYITICIVMLVRHFLVQDIDVSEAESKILTNRLLFSPKCLAYTDPVQGRVEIGVIDYDAFSSHTLNECANFSSSNDFAAAKLTLDFLDTDEIKDVYYNQEGYEAWLPRIGFAGPGGAVQHYEWRYVLVQDDSGLRKALLIIDVLTPNY